jgi:hypothetical protein
VPLPQQLVGFIQAARISGPLTVHVDRIINQCHVILVLVPGHPAPAVAVRLPEGIIPHDAQAPRAGRGQVLIFAVP